MQALLVLIENWKKVLDNKGFGGAVLMDLPKAFDTINNDIFIAKLHASGTQLGERGGDFPCPFLKIEKKCADFGNKGPYCLHLRVESFIQNVVLRVSRRKSSKIFPCGTVFSFIFDEKFIEVP